MNSTEQDDCVMKIVEAALRQPAGQRETYVRVACDGDDNLQREVAEAITWEIKMGGFMQHPMVMLEDPARLLEPAQKIEDDRFEIIRKIGEGGMGIVYEAIDQKRHQRVALKFARLGFQGLLSPELEGALKVRHPNICLVNQIHTTSIDGNEVDFLTMEYVEGVTLSHYLDEHGALPTIDALEITRQLCAGLSEAHRTGIVHRDLKAGNVMLSRDQKNDLRVVIMDFGLAGELSVDSAEGGTPGYMAPELLKGQKASFASDIYALGVMLYEIVTGQKPARKQTPDSSKQTAVAAPTGLNDKLDPRWDKAILPCLDPSPQLRPKDAHEVIARLTRKPFRKSPLVAVLCAILVLLAIPQIRGRIVNRFWPPPNVRLAILPVEGTAKSTDISEGVLQDVSDRIRRMNNGQRTLVVIPPSEVLDKQVQSPERAHEVLHATHALETHVDRDGDDFVIKASIVDLDTRTPLREFTGRYSAVTVGNMPGALASTVSLALQLHAPATPETLSAAATPAYDRALYLLRRDEASYDEAIGEFEKAATLDPRSSLPLAGLVEAKIMKFDQTQQESSLIEAQTALRSAESLNPDSPRVRLAAGMLKETSSQYEQALEDYRRVQQLEPHNVEVLRRMASVYDKLDLPSQAIETYQKAIALDPDYYGGYHGLGVFYYYRGNYPEAAKQFQLSIDRAPGLFDEYTNLGATLDELGRDTEAEQALQTSLKLRETYRALNNMGAMRAYQKRDAEAVSYYNRAVALDPSDYVCFENLADSYRRLGKARESDAAYRRAMDLAMTALRENPRLGYPRGYVAYIAARLGDRKRAEDEIAQALRMSPGETKVIRNAVLTFETLGERDKAIQVLASASPDLLRELNRQPDLADFREDSRFKQILANLPKGGI
jgi:serine/threonine protein kinase/tetratricopeptide (TPR) repeat protein